MHQPSRPSVALLALALILASTVLAGGAAASGPSFVDVAANPATGLTYERTPSAREAVFEALRQQPFYTLADVAFSPIKARGAPGIALIDYDGDGDLDVYVTNGPGTANSLFENRLVPDGSFTFVDVAVAVGVDATAQDTSGVCFGDLDNDGDPDLLALGTGEPNRLFENLGGTFVDATGATNGLLASEIGGGYHWSSSCSMGDVDGDGLLDVFVGNAFHDWSQQLAIVAVPFAQNEPDQLFLNRGGLVFEEVGQAAGIHDLGGIPPGFYTITWATGLLDYDGDGDVDIIHADDQAAVPPARYGGVDRGYIQIHDNDGSGHFVSTTLAAGTNKTGQWMGLSFGDFNCDGRIDLFGSNVGDYLIPLFGGPYALGDSTSRWFLQSSAGGFDDPGVGAIVGTPFGWGTVPLDADNDGDLDIVYHGGLDAGPFVDASNPGVLFENPDCSAQFTWNDAAFAIDHRRRNVQGVAVGDLDQDGYADVLSVSNFNFPAPAPLVPYPALWGSPFDAPLASIVATFVPTATPGVFVPSGLQQSNGSLVVEINQGGGNGSVVLEPRGGAGLVSGGAVNRSGIGAVFTVTPQGGKPVTRPVMGGSSYASEDALVQPYGLGAAKRATVEVLWPGGVRNRLYGARAGERWVFPEIPCSYDGDWSGPAAYGACVRAALDEWVAAGVLTDGQRARLLSSALHAFAQP